MALRRIMIKKINEKTLVYCFLIEVGFYTTGKKIMSVFQVVLSREMDI